VARLYQFVLTAIHCDNQPCQPTYI